MTVLIEEGPLWLDAIWRVSALDGAFPFLMNDLGAWKRGEQWRFKIENLAGWKDDAETPDAGEEKVYGAIGALPTPGTAGGKSFAITGVLQARTLPQLGIALQAMKKAARNHGPGSLTVDQSLFALTPLPFRGDPFPHWYFKGRIQQITPDQQWTHDRNETFGPYQLGVVLSIRMFDPRVLWWERMQGSGAGQVTLPNPGDAPADPQIAVTVADADAPATVTIFNDTLGRKLKFIDVPAGELVVDFAPPRRARLYYNVAENPDFDSNVDGWTAVNPATTLVQDGAGAAHVTGSTGGQIGMRMDWDAGNEASKDSDGEIVTATARVDVTNAFDNGVRLLLYWLDGVTLLSITEGPFVSGTGLKDLWVQGAFPPGATYVALGIESSGTPGSGPVDFRVRDLVLAEGDYYAGAPGDSDPGLNRVTAESDWWRPRQPPTLPETDNTFRQTGGSKITVGYFPSSWS